MVLNFDIFLIF